MTIFFICVLIDYYYENKEEKMQHIFEIFWMNPVWQTFGLLWMLCVVSAFLQKDDHNVVKILILANIFWAIHFYFMWVYSWMWVAVIGVLRLIMSIKYKRNNKVFLWVLLMTFWLGMITYENIHSLFPVFASCLATYWFFYLEKIKLRLLLLVVSAFWFSFHYIHFSIWWVINESILQVVHLFTIYRILVEQGTTRAYIQSLKDKIVRTPKIDYGRYLAVIDFIKMKNKK